MMQSLFHVVKIDCPIKERLIRNRFFALTLSGVATLWMAVFVDIGASLVVVFHCLRPLRFGDR